LGVGRESKPQVFYGNSDKHRLRVGNNTASNFKKMFSAAAKKRFLGRYVIAAIRAVKRLKA
jgi:hypothetical protein